MVKGIFLGVLFTSLSLFFSPCFAQGVKKKIVKDTAKEAVLVLPVEDLTPTAEITQASETDAFEDEKPDSGKLIGLNELLLGLFTTLWGIIAKALRLKTKFPNFVFVVLSGGIVIAGIMFHWGFVGGLNASLAVLASMGLWNVIKGTGRQMIEDITKEETEKAKA